MKLNRKNSTAPINTLIDWKEVNYTYEFLQKEYVKENNSVSYTCSWHFQPTSYPDTLRLAIELAWENGSRKYEHFSAKRNTKAGSRI